MVDALASSLLAASARFADIDPTTQQVVGLFLGAAVAAALAAGVFVGHVMTRAAGR